MKTFKKVLSVFVLFLMSAGLFSAPNTKAQIGDYVEIDDSLKNKMYGTINFPDAELSAVVDAIAELSKKNFILDSKLKNKRISIKSTIEVTNEEAYNAFLSALYMNNLTIVSSGKFLRIIEIKDAPRSNTRVFYGEDVPNNDEVVTLVYPVKNLNADDMPRYIQDLIPRTARIITYPETNSLVLTDTGTNLRRLISILKKIDVPGLQTKLASIKIQYASAKEIAALLDEIIEAQTGGSSSRRSSRRNSTQKKIQGGGIITKIVPDERTNSLVILANEPGILEIKKLIAKLDTSDAKNKGNIHIYYCKNALSEELAKTLNSLVSTTASNSARPAFTAPGSDTRRSTSRTRNSRSTNRRAGASTSGVTLGGEIKITSDKPTNSLVIKSSASDFASLKEILKKLDIPRRQVHIEAVIMEVTASDAKEFSSGVNISQDGIAQAGGFIPGTLGPGDFSSMVGTPAGLNGLLGLFAFGKKVNINVGGVPVPIGSVQGLFKAIQTTGNGEVLQTPNILTSDNEEAEFKFNQKITVEKGRSVSGAGEDQVINIDYDRIDVDLILKITPQIGEENDLVKLAVEQTVSDFKSAANALGQIDTTERYAKTTVTIRDGHTIAIGGITRDVVSQERSKLPILGDLPIIGNLFQGKKTSNSKSNLVLFLTPRIIRSNQDLLEVTHEKLTDRHEIGKSIKEGKYYHKKEVKNYLKKVQDMMCGIRFEKDYTKACSAYRVARKSGVLKNMKIVTEKYLSDQQKKNLKVIYEEGVPNPPDSGEFLNFDDVETPAPLETFEDTTVQNFPQENLIVEPPMATTYEEAPMQDSSVNGQYYDNELPGYNPNGSTVVEIGLPPPVTIPDLPSEDDVFDSDFPSFDDLPEAR